MPKPKTIPVVLGTALLTCLAPASAIAVDAADASGSASSQSDPAGDPSDASSADAEPRSTPDGVATIVRDGQAMEFSSLEQAVSEARDGETVQLSGSFELDGVISVSDGRSLTLLATGSCAITRSASFPQSAGKVLGMVKLSGASRLDLRASDASSAEIVLDGESKDSDEAILVVDGGSSLTMGEGVTVSDAKSSWKPWAGVYVRSGSFVLDGGSILNGFAMKNSAVAVEQAASFEMRDGLISGNRSSYSEAAIWSKGRVSILGGSIEGNTANSGAEQTGVIQLLGGSLTFTGGTIGGNSVRSSIAILVNGGTLEMGGAARVTGDNRIALKGQSTISFQSALTGHSLSDPLPVTLADSWDPGRVVATFSDAETARGALAYLAAKSGGQGSDVVSLCIDAADPTRLSVVSGETAELFSLLESPYADNLGLTLREEFRAADAFSLLRQRLEQAYDGAESPESAERFARLDYLERQAAYLEASRDAVEASVISLSELGSPSADRERTQQNFMFDNLDITGYYLKPGQVNELYLYLDAEDPSKVSLAWRQVGLTEDGNYGSLNLQQRSQLSNGANRIVIDLTGSAYGYMLYLRNDSTANHARARLEGVDANLPDAPAIIGTQLGEHPFYVHDTSDPGAFWEFVQRLRSYVAAVDRGEAEDMTVLQMGDQGRAQFAIRASALANSYSSISSVQDAVAYVERSNAAIQERLEFFWGFDGFEEGVTGANAISAMRVHTCFTKTVSYPSTMYATGRYFHMPEGTARDFLSGSSMYGWGMSHEYGHVLDNSILVVNEETNNMYSIAGSRNGELLASRAQGREFSASRAYHENALRAARLWDEELAKMAGDPSYAPDWNAGGWGRYIWAHLSAWWNGTHFLDGWDYSDYDHSSSPFTAEQAEEVERWGAFGATMRMLRGDSEARAKVESLTASIQDGTSRKYNRIALSYTMATGFDFASYLRTMGQQDLSQEVIDYCAQYPEMPRKVHYYSLHADAAEINGATPYQGSITPIVTASVSDGTARVEAEMRTDKLEASTIAYELYLEGDLVGFSRTGSFEVRVGDDVDAGAFSVIAYDVRLNPSEPGSATGVPFDLVMPEMTVGDADAHAIIIDGPTDATYSFSVDDESVIEVAEGGSIVVRSAGSTDVRVTMSRPGKPDQGPFKFTAVVSPRAVTLSVADATMLAGTSLPAAEVSVTSGSLLEGDELGEVRLEARREDGGAADLGTPGSYLLYAEATGLGSNYLVDVLPGTLVVTQDEADGTWLSLRDAAGNEVADEAWTNGEVTVYPVGTSIGAGAYDEISLGEDSPFGASATVSQEGVHEHVARLRVSEGAQAGAVSSATTFVTRIDTTAPEVLPDAGERTSTLSTGVTLVSARASDDPAEGVNESSGVASMRVLVLDESGSTVDEHEVSGDRIELALVEPGSYRVLVSAVDHAGNVSAPLELEAEVPGDPNGGDGPLGPDAGEGGDQGSDGQPDGPQDPEGDDGPEAPGNGPEVPEEGPSSPEVPGVDSEVPEEGPSSPEVPGVDPGEDIEGEGPDLSAGTGQGQGNASGEHDANKGAGTVAGGQSQAIPMTGDPAVPAGGLMALGTLALVARRALARVVRGDE